jgi:PAS domain S-box-containing protein
MQGPLSAHRDAVLERLAASSNSPLVTEFPRGALFAFDRDLRLLAVGGPMLVVFGMDQEGIVGLRPSEFLAPAAMERVEASWRRVLAGETSRMDVPYEGRTYQHELAPVVVDGEVVAGLGYLQDVTEARAAVRALADAEQRQRLLLEHAPIGMAVVGLDGRFLQVNPALCTMLGYAELTLLDLTFQHLTHPDDLDQDVDYLHQLLAGTIEGVETEKRYITASGAVLWASLSVALVTDSEGEPLYFVSQVLDITERKRQHDALRDLTAMMAHDLRGPTGAMSGLLTVLLSTWDTRTEEQRLAIVRRVSETAHLTMDLLQNSLTASTLDAQQLTARAEQVVLADAIGTILDNVPHQRLETTVSCPPGISCWVDAGQFVQAMTNLVSNAVKYGGDHLDIHVRDEAGSTWITVSDDGPGVPVDFVPLLFERFSRAPEAKRGIEKGSGLGLYIVRDLMRLNGGEVFYAPAEDGGAAFTLRLPAAPAQ